MFQANALNYERTEVNSSKNKAKVSRVNLHYLTIDKNTGLLSFTFIFNFFPKLIHITASEQVLICN